jgi:hypothetical protein
MSTTITQPSQTATRPAKPSPAAAPGAAEPAMPDLSTIVGYKLRRAQLSTFQDFIEAFAKLKVRPAEFSVLAMIARSPGLKQTEIAEALGIKRANFVALMDGLERRGLAAFAAPDGRGSAFRRENARHMGRARAASHRQARRRGRTGSTDRPSRPHNRRLTSVLS